MKQILFNIVYIATVDLSNKIFGKAQQRSREKNKIISHTQSEY